MIANGDIDAIDCFNADSSLSTCLASRMAKDLLDVWILSFSVGCMTTCSKTL